MTLEGSPWFVAADVCRALDLGMAKGAGRYLQHLAADERRTLPPEIFGGKVGTIMGVVGIAESGLYKLTLRSTKPQARAFQDWVTRVVLPTIRTTGSYVVGEEKLADPATPRDELEAISEAVEELLKKKAALLEARLAGLLEIAKNCETPPQAGPRRVSPRGPPVVPLVARGPLRRQRGQSFSRDGRQHRRGGRDDAGSVATRTSM